ncbi:TPA: hypothetical protein RQN00_001358 [Aeromonas dhakensis]|nr:hypothetical protein [Aeromonas dhakensis]
MDATEQMTTRRSTSGGALFLWACLRKSARFAGPVRGDPLAKVMMNLTGITCQDEYNAAPFPMLDPIHVFP